jgi:hypothetical protein
MQWMFKALPYLVTLSINRPVESKCGWAKSTGTNKAEQPMSQLD